MRAERSARDLSFGVSITPRNDVALVRELAVAADSAGLDLIGLQDHPYNADYLDAIAFAGDLLHRTQAVTVFTDVANLPLRPPAVLARTAASLNVLSDGRFALGLGAGGYWEAIESMGVSRMGRAEARAALEEAIAIMRGLWSPREVVRVQGGHHRVDGVAGADPGPGGVAIWIGAQGPKSFELTGRLADGWAAPIPSYLPYERWPAANETIDAAARAAGRDPSDVARIAQVVGAIVPRSSDPGAHLRQGDAPLVADASQWAEALADLGREQPFRTFIFWPIEESVEQVRRFAEDVVPRVEELLG
jgi:alkanesulfonate monooxygenase SsuD/methylene tetrahydromethanopterin reductase-like flavin-dependent oxidoreductase (luciferase family)